MYTYSLAKIHKKNYTLLNNYITIFSDIHAYEKWDEDRGAENRPFPTNTVRNVFSFV